MPHDAPHPHAAQFTPLGSPLKESDCQGLSRQVETRFDEWKAARQGLEYRWQQCYNAYLGKGFQPSEQGSSRKEGYQVHRPVTFEVVEQLHSALLEGLMPNQTLPFSVQGRSEADHAKAADVKLLLESKLAEAKLYPTLHAFLKQLLLYGNSVLALPWKKESQLMPRLEPLKKLGVTVGYLPVQEEQVCYDAPAFEVLNLFDVVVDPQADSLNDGTLIRQCRSHLEALKASGLYQGLEAVAVALEGLKEQPQTLTLLEGWGHFTLPSGERLEGCVLTLVKETGTLIRCEAMGLPQGQKPFLWATLTPLPQQLYGLGCVQPVLGLQYAINALSNQKLDVLNLCINAPYTYLITDDIFDPETVMHRPGALIPVKSHETLRPLALPAQNLDAAYQEIADLRQEMLEATGVHRLQAESGNRLNGRTALEVQALVSQGQQKLGGTLSHLEQSFLEPLLGRVYRSMQHFMAGQNVVRRVGKDGGVQYHTVATDWLPCTHCQFSLSGQRGLLQEQREYNALLQLVELLKAIPEGWAKVDTGLLLRQLLEKLGLRQAVLRTEK